jgi:hypothetical protein
LEVVKFVLRTKAYSCFFMPYSVDKKSNMSVSPGTRSLLQPVLPVLIQKGLPLYDSPPVMQKSLLKIIACSNPK